MQLVAGIGPKTPAKRGYKEGKSHANAEDKGKWEQPWRGGGIRFRGPTPWTTHT